MKRFLKWAFVSLGIIVFLGLSGFVWMGYSLRKQIEPKVDPQLYSNIVSVRARSSSKYTFLPVAINPAAEKVAFFHIPGFLQGGDVIALRLRLPEKEVTDMVAALESSGRTEIRSFDDIPKPHCYPEYGLKRPSNNNLFAGVDELPDGFRIFLFQSDLGDIKTNWNHNFMAFTAVSVKRREVVYYADNW